MGAKDKMVSADLDQWEHPKRVVALAPIFFVIGWSVGFFAVPHFVESSMVEGVLNALFGMIGLLIGLVMLAVVD